ncbi:hypothetical protein [Streptomyces sp. SP18CS02]|uniref:hypothetical protein n=1 Tax=Streptomyces sp. SP18CS02 TaxID=3002531 RepID=UPI002E76CB93|nr:hypothetical protein [Streptomyces sp. SP18CS02]MEE1755769.1 hypothetical protein [Streptomyces sp. SP18CS02]
MKIRHVRAVAVFGVVLVALTGARGSGGGSCGGGHSSSSGSGHDNDSSSSSGGSSGGSLPGGSSSAKKAERDVRIDECAMDATGKNLVAKITITNSDSLAYTYDVSLQFKGETGGPAADLAIARADDVLVPASGSQSAEATTPYTGSGNGSEYKKCEVISASRVAG